MASFRRMRTYRNRPVWHAGRSGTPHRHQGLGQEGLKEMGPMSTPLYLNHPLAELAWTCVISLPALNPPSIVYVTLCQYGFPEFVVINLIALSNQIMPSNQIRQDQVSTSTRLNQKMSECSTSQGHLAGVPSSTETVNFFLGL